VNNVHVKSKTPSCLEINDGAAKEDRSEGYLDRSVRDGLPVPFLGDFSLGCTWARQSDQWKREEWLTLRTILRKRDAYGLWPVFRRGRWAKRKGLQMTLEAEGKAEHQAGKVEKKVGQIKKVFEK
jgi:hypothetical protein